MSREEVNVCVPENRYKSFWTKLCHITAAIRKHLQAVTSSKGLLQISSTNLKFLMFTVNAQRL